MTFVPYKVDHQVQNAAKTLGFSKKKVNFKFGFASLPAIEEGKAGAGCRGSEHEVVFIWSLKSGKRQLMVDGKDVHFSESGQNGWMNDRSWQHSFVLNDNATGERYNIHFISQPPRPEIHDAHPFDLRVNGVSYFKFNEIWKLGSAQMMVRGGERSAGSSGRRYRQAPPPDQGLSAEEERQIAHAKLESLRDLAKHQDQPPAPPTNGGDASLISFDAPPPSQVVVPSSMPPQQQQPSLNAFAAPAPSPYAGAATTVAYGAPPPPAAAYGGQPAYNAFAPAPVAATATTTTTQLTSYTGPPAPYGGGVAAPAPMPSYTVPPPVAAAPYGAPQQQQPYAAQTPTYAGSGGGMADNPFASPGGQTEYSYGSAPSFARPPPAAAAAPAPGYPPQPSYGMPPQQQQSPPPYGTPYAQQQ